MLEKLTPLLHHYIKPKDTLILGVSGGPDSTALLDILLQFSKTTPIHIIVAHINHGIRGREALTDEQFVKKRAQENGLIFEVKRIRLSGKSGLEERGREARRAFFEKLRRQYRARWVLTAHTEDDQLETIVFNFLRGSGPAGLAGMNILDGYYLKPFINISKSEILAYLESRKLPFRTDSTNKDTRFRRNFIREKILPLLTHINPSFRKTIIRNSEIFAQLNHFMEYKAQDFLRKHRKENVLFSLKAYEKLPQTLQSEVIQESYRQCAGTQYRLPMTKVQEIVRLCKRKIGNKKILCPRGGSFFLQKGEIIYLSSI